MSKLLRYFDRLGNRFHLGFKPLQSPETNDTPYGVMVAGYDVGADAIRVVTGTASNNYTINEQTVSGAGPTQPVKFTREIALQVTGTAEYIQFKVERSTRAPGDNPNWAPVGDPLDGNPKVDFQVEGFDEPATAWWRVNVLNITTGNALISMSGGAA